MAAKPADRIRTMINDLERGARTLGDDIRKRAGNVAGSDIEHALRQLLQGLSQIAAQLEKAAGELRRYLEKSAKATKKASARKPSARGAAKKTKTRSAKAPAAKSSKKSAPKKKAR